MSLVALFTLATPAWGDSTFPQNAHLEAAQSAADDGDLDHANRELQKALAQPDNSDDVLVEIYKLQSIVALSQGNTTGARQALEKLFQARPDYALPKGSSPKMRDLFNQVQRDVRQRRIAPVTLEFEPITHLTAGGPARIPARVQDLPADARVRLYYRRMGTETFGAVDFQRSDAGHVAASLPAAELPLDAAPFGLEYYLEIDDSAGRRLAGRGDALAPLTAQVEVPNADGPQPLEAAPVATEDRAWYDHWYVWVGAGVIAAAGAGVGVYYATRPNTGTLPVTVSVNGP